MKGRTIRVTTGKPLRSTKLDLFISFEGSQLDLQWRRNRGEKVGGKKDPPTDLKKEINEVNNTGKGKIISRPSPSHVVPTPLGTLQRQEGLTQFFGERYDAFDQIKFSWRARSPE
ncbi:hypothetical protein ISCGN_001298 [Ixodes scapularis]